MRRIALGMCAVALGGLTLAPAADAKKKKRNPPVAAFAQSASVAPESTQSVTASCPANKTLVGGGFGSGPVGTLTGPSLGTFVFESHRDGANAWKVSAFNEDGVEQGTVSAYAYCRKRAAPLIEAAVTISADCACIPKLTVVATCPDGNRAVAGGFLSPTDNVDLGVITQASRRFGQFAWRWEGFDIVGLTRDVTAYAYCAPRARTETTGVRVIEGEGEGGTAFAQQCRRRGQRMLAGGFEAAPADLILGSTFQLIAQSNQVDGRFATTAREGLFGPGILESYGYCG
jgi:hypothetical protein